MLEGGRAATNVHKRGMARLQSEITSWLRAALQGFGQGLGAAQLVSVSIAEEEAFRRLPSSSGGRQRRLNNERSRSLRKICCTRGRAEVRIPMLLGVQDELSYLRS